MKYISLKNKYLRILLIILIAIATTGLFAGVSYVALYQTEFYHHSIWTFLGPSDNRFHMMRIEGLYQSILHHNYFPLVNMSFMEGLGYISNIFYSDFLIYPAAFLRLMGFTPAQTIVRFYLLLNFLTFTVSFLCFFKVSKKYWNSLVFSFVYTLANYRLHDMLFRHDLGEIGAFVFLPIAVLGIYEIFYGERKRNWLFLAFGMTGIIYSHAISPILVAILIVLVMLCQIPELRVHPKRLLSLIWAAVASGLLSIGYFLPMLEQLKHTTLRLTESKSILPTGADNLVDYFHWSIDNVINKPNIGIVLLLAGLAALVSMGKIENKAVKHFAGIGAIMFICGSKIFPWVMLNKTPFKMIQYPWRFDMIATILLAIFVASDPLHLLKGNLVKAALIVFVTLLAISASYRMVNSMSTAMVPYSEYDKASPFSIGGGQEYLPDGADIVPLEAEPQIPTIKAGKKAKITNFKRVDTKMTFNFKHAKKTVISVPVIAYYGFQSKESTGNVSKLTMNKKNNGLGEVTVSGNGKVVIDYYETHVQKTARHFSFWALVVLVIGAILSMFNFKWSKFKPWAIEMKNKLSEKKAVKSEKSEPKDVPESEDTQESKETEESEIKEKSKKTDDSKNDDSEDKQVKE
ncbi:hypothetical protein ACFQAV_05335 [Companilactobacillus huachuanensis]|uniref:YfhO family protein n=1 Tax=Companilactobacillus huachuanensis TaxID=2559914 RepID=A0ABW1RK82_9LACO|nr:hypothetical protein [Companilactobacillus huachuanensis]